MKAAIFCQEQLKGGFIFNTKYGLKIPEKF